MKKLLVIGLVLSTLTTVSFAQLVPGLPGPNPTTGKNAQLIQELDVAKYDIKSTLSFLSSSGSASATATSYLNDALQRIDRVQQALKGNPGPGPITPLPTIAVGDIVYKGSSYSQGARVEAVNLMQGRATVRSVVSGSAYTELIDSLYLSKGCIYNVCVGSLVFKGSSYSQGAIVMGLNSKLQKATVRSKVSGSLFEENLSDLDVAN